MRILFGTTNRGKCEEVSRVTRRMPGVEICGLEEVRSALQLEPWPEVVESSLTYEGNARLKAVAYARWSSLPTLADDTGIEVASLGGLPGIYTARFGLRRLQELLAPGIEHAARFVCCMCYGEPSGRAVSVTVRMPGVFLFDEGGVMPESTLQYSHFFTPAGENRTIAQLQSDSDFRSHRARALEALLRCLSFSEV